MPYKDRHKSEMRERKIKQDLRETHLGGREVVESEINYLNEMNWQFKPLSKSRLNWRGKEQKNNRWVLITEMSQV